MHRPHTDGFMLDGIQFGDFFIYLFFFLRLQMYFDWSAFETAHTCVWLTGWLCMCLFSNSYTQHSIAMNKLDFNKASFRCQSTFDTKESHMQFAAFWFICVIEAFWCKIVCSYLIINGTLSLTNNFWRSHSKELSLYGWIIAIWHEIATQQFENSSSQFKAVFVSYWLCLLN